MPVHYSESVNQSSLICRYTFTKCCRLQLDDASIAGATLEFQSSSSSNDVAENNTFSFLGGGGCLVVNQCIFIRKISLGG